MTYRFRVDANLPVALARQLSAGNVDCAHSLTAIANAADAMW